MLCRIECIVRQNTQYYMRNLAHAIMHGVYGISYRVHSTGNTSLGHPCDASGSDRRIGKTQSTLAMAVGKNKRLTKGGGQELSIPRYDRAMVVVQGLMHRALLYDQHRYPERGNSRKRTLRIV